MGGDQQPDAASGSSRPGPTDRDLVVRLLAGDESAVRILVDRYDRLIRYTVFKTAKRHCDRDPGWLDARANEAWTGAIASLRRSGTQRIPPNLAAYLAQIARNKSLDAAKKADARAVIPFDEYAAGAGNQDASDPADDPAEMLASVEELDALRDCMSRLSEEEQVICAEIALIVERRWQEAAERLEMPESTLRSKWRQVIGKLKICLEKKNSKKSRAGE